MIAALVVLFGGLMLAIRSGDSLLSALLQRESTDARDAAETGMTRIVGELNKPRNRGLLAKKGSEEDVGVFLWTSGDVQRNPCLPIISNPRFPGEEDYNQMTAPDLATNPDLGNRSSSDPLPQPTYDVVLLDAAGQRVTDSRLAVKSYRLVSVKRQPLVRADGSDGPTLKIFDPAGRGRVTLVVEGASLRNGEVVSRSSLTQEFQLVPKCCNASFGGSHGNVNYAQDSKGGSICLPSGLGFVAGIAQTSSGSVTINGVTTIRDEAGAIVDPVSCVASALTECSFNPTSTPYTLQLVKSFLPKVPVNPSVSGSVMGSITKSTAVKPNFLYCKEASEASTIGKCPGGNVILKASAAVGDLPDYCMKGESEDVRHCNLKVLDYGQLNIEVIETGLFPLRLYFPSSGDVIRSTGGGTLSHAGEPFNFVLFGCGPCADPQAIKLAGGASGLHLIAWFPKGEISVSGGAADPAYSGVIWANRITSNGGVTWEIPSDAVTSALKLAGFGLEKDLNPPFFDWVARSVHSFSWAGL
ncbi:MAG: hypothetical protein ACKO0M_16005 [Cyanobium sp.]